MRRILITLTLIAVCAIAAYSQRDRLTPEAPKVGTPIAYRYEYCYVRPGTASVVLLTDAGPKTIAPAGGTWERLVSQIGNEGWELVGQGPDEKGAAVLWFRRGRRE